VSSAGDLVIKLRSGLFMDLSTDSDLFRNLPDVPSSSLQDAHEVRVHGIVFFLLLALRNGSEQDRYPILVAVGAFPSEGQRRELSVEFILSLACGLHTPSTGG
jgi:hypothetical protein